MRPHRNLYVSKKNNKSFTLCHIWMLNMMKSLHIYIRCIHSLIPTYRLMRYNYKIPKKKDICVCMPTGKNQNFKSIWKEKRDTTMIMKEWVEDALRRCTHPFRIYLSARFDNLMNHSIHIMHTGALNIHCKPLKRYAPFTVEMVISIK